MVCMYVCMSSIETRGKSSATKASFLHWQASVDPTWQAMMLGVGVLTPTNLPLTFCSCRTTNKISSTIIKEGVNKNKKRQFGGNFVQIFRNDLQFLKNRVTQGVEWANQALMQLPPQSEPPQPHYPELSGMDLFMADVEASLAYASYFYYLTKLWTKPLPEVYDPEEVAFYFSLRPHLVALRLLEVLSSFAVAAIQIRLLGVRNFPRSATSVNIDGDATQYGFGMVLKETMLNLGPTFIKVGQSLSTRPDIIGREISMALSELHDRIPAFPRAIAMKIVEEELGPIDKYFSQISEEPVAAASFGQVYQGRTVDGLNVAVKVQRPYLRDVVVRDVYILRLGLHMVQKITRRKSDLRLYADELGKGLVGELDYTLEAANALEFKEAHAPYSFVRVPKVYEHLSGKRVLTMEWMFGESPSHLVNLSTQRSANYGSTYSEQQRTDAKRRLLDLVKKGVEVSLIQLLDTGLLHADPHPGNLLYTSSGEIGFVDFGLLCRMQKKHQLAMLASIVHIVNGEWASLVHALSDMDVLRTGTNMRRVTADLEDALGEVEFRDGMPDVKFSRVLGQILSLAVKYHMRMPPYFTLVLRSLASLEGLAVAGDPNFKTFEAAFPFVVQKLLTDNSAASRKILYSVVLNKRKELQWQRVALFLRAGKTRKGLLRIIASNDETSSLKYSSNKLFDLTELVLRFLHSKDGIVMRKLLMTANGASLIRAAFTKEAKFFWQSTCMVIADIVYEWMSKLAFGRDPDLHYTTRQGLYLSGSENGRFASYDYWKFLRDRRLKVISLRILDSARREDPVLVFKFCLACLKTLVTASALAFHQMLITLSEVYVGSPGDSNISFARQGGLERAAVTP